MPKSGNLILKPMSQNYKTRMRKNSNGNSIDVNLKSPILGKNFKTPDLYYPLTVMTFDDTLPYVSLFINYNNF
jgi:hypothetical protein